MNHKAQKIVHDFTMISGLVTGIGVLVMVFGQVQGSLALEVRGSATFQVGLALCLLLISLQAFMRKYYDVYNEENAGVYQVFKNAQPKMFWAMFILMITVGVVLLIVGGSLFFADPHELTRPSSQIVMQGP